MERIQFRLSDGQVFESEEQIGEGGFGQIFKVRDQQGKICVVKTLKDISSDSDKIAIKNEIKQVQNINHDNVISYKGVGEYQEKPFIVMEYASQGNLRNVIQKGFINQYDLQTLINMLIQLTQGIQEINKHVVHRDLKPDNILFFDGIPKISDFGLAKAVGANTRTLTFKGLGTPFYMAPEAWLKEKQTDKMDVYSMGILFYEILTRENPFQEVKNTIELQNKHLQEELVFTSQHDKDLPLKIKQIIRKMTAKSPSQRPTWEEVLQCLHDSQKTDYGDKETIESLGQIMNKQATIQNEQQQKKDAEKTHKTQVNNFFKNSVINLIKDVVEDINVNLVDEFYKIIFEKNTSTHNQFTLRWMKETTINIDFQVLPLESDRYYSERKNALGDTIKDRLIPQFNGKPILGWAYVQFLPSLNSKRGFNLFILGDGSPEEVILVEFERSPLRQDTRDYPRPLFLNIDELWEEYRKFDVMGVYQHTLKEWNRAYWKRWINTIIDEYSQSLDQK